MIDLTPIDIRKKKNDFRKAVRGYDTTAVDDFLDLVADRVDELVRESIQMRERIATLSQAMAGYQERERAMNDALVSAQQLREEVRAQAAREAELVVREAELKAERMLGDLTRQTAEAREALQRIHGQRVRYLRGYRAFVERQLGDIEQEEARLTELVRADGELGSPAGRARAEAADDPGGMPWETEPVVSNEAGERDGG